MASEARAQAVALRGQLRVVRDSSRAKEVYHRRCSGRSADREDVFPCRIRQWPCKLGRLDEALDLRDEMAYGSARASPVVAVAGMAVEATEAAE
jgi:hypothetical protein